MASVTVSAPVTGSSLPSRRAFSFQQLWRKKVPASYNVYHDGAFSAKLQGHSPNDSSQLFKMTPMTSLPPLTQGYWCLLFSTTPYAVTVTKPHGPFWTKADKFRVFHFFSWSEPLCGGCYMARPTGVLLWAFFSKRLNLWKEVLDVAEFYFVTV